jgi:C1A family cysteine protease
MLPGPQISAPGKHVLQ